MCSLFRILVHNGIFSYRNSAPVGSNIPHCVISNGTCFQSATKIIWHLLYFQPNSEHASSLGSLSELEGGYPQSFHCKKANSFIWVLLRKRPCWREQSVFKKKITSFRFISFPEFIFIPQNPTSCFVRSTRGKCVDNPADLHWFCRAILGKTKDFVKI